MVTITVVAFAAVVVLAAVLGVSRRDRKRLAATTTMLAESESRLRMMAETVPAGIFHIDSEGRRLYVNPKLTEITGDPSMAPGEARAWLVYEPDLPLLQTEWRRAAEAKSDIHLTFRIRRMDDGSVRWIHIDARPLLDGDGSI